MKKKPANVLKTLRLINRETPAVVEHRGKMQAIANERRAHEIAAQKATNLALLVGHQAKLHPRLVSADVHLRAKQAYHKLYK
jgi:hypothetical protein